MQPDLLGDVTLGEASCVHPEQMLELRAADVPPDLLVLPELWLACANEEGLQVTWDAFALRMSAYEINLKYASISFRSWRSRFAGISPSTLC